MDLRALPQAALAGELLPSCIVASLVGFLSHILYWIRGNHDPQAARIVGLHLLAFTVVCSQMVVVHGVLRGILYGSAMNFSYLVSLFTSMVIYRVCFHPLREFPGPIMAKITKLYGPIWQARNGKGHEEHFELVKKYGDFVRSGMIVPVSHLHP
jgi:cytochrome P450 family 628